MGWKNFALERERQGAHRTAASAGITTAPAASTWGQTEQCGDGYTWIALGPWPRIDMTQSMTISDRLEPSILSCDCGVSGGAISLFDMGPRARPRIEENGSESILLILFNILGRI
jgi:hypothetical protein